MSLLIISLLAVY